MTTALTPAEYEALSSEEQKAYDEKRRIQEKEEQNALPYKWQQTLQEVSVNIPVTKGTKGKQCTIKFAKKHLSVVVNGEKIMEGDLPHEIKLEESTWAIEDQKEIQIHLEKINQQNWWKHVLTHDPEIDTTKIQPENSKLSDLDGETRGMVEKMMVCPRVSNRTSRCDTNSGFKFDQKQKQMGLPTSDELNKQEMLKKFQAQHPEMDVSYALA